MDYPTYCAKLREIALHHPMRRIDALAALDITFEVARRCWVSGRSLDEAAAELVIQLNHEAVVRHQLALATSS